MVFDGAISQQSVGGTTERRYKNKLLRNINYNMTVAMGADKRCAASELTLQVELVAERSTACENALAKTLQN